MKTVGSWVAAGLGITAASLVARAGRSDTSLVGRRKRPMTRALSAGARLLQRRSPLQQFDTYVAGLHPLKADPEIQMEAHHYCRVVNEDFIQCIVFDGNGWNARLTGVEFIISERLFAGLPAEEKPMWHPHNYEILSGQLIAPGIPRALEQRLMQRLMNSYGKTWHFWMTGRGDALPLGPACLAWSFNRDGEAHEALVRDRNHRMHVDMEDLRARRAKLTQLAIPQEGVDALVDPLGTDGTRPAGVRDASEVPARDWQQALR